MRKPAKTVNAVAAENKSIQIRLLTRKILKPSKSPIGIRLNIATKEFQKPPKRHETASELGVTNANPRKTTDKTILVDGPAAEILSTALGVNGPEIITAPGAKILNTGEIAVINVNNAPHKVRRNSAHKPSNCATILCANS